MTSFTRAPSPAPASRRTEPARRATAPQAAAAEPQLAMHPGLRLTDIPSPPSLDQTGSNALPRYVPPVAQRQVEAPTSRSGLPVGLKVGVEALSGVAMDKVRVRYRSPEPARFGASAFTQGRDIHLGPGQEHHLPHEAWHVVQQAQGRVKPTARSGPELAINTDDRLEREATLMGKSATSARSSRDPDRMPQGMSGVSRMQQNVKATAGGRGASASMSGQKALSDTLPSTANSATPLQFGGGPSKQLNKVTRVGGSTSGLNFGKSSNLQNHPTNTFFISNYSTKRRNNQININKKSKSSIFQNNNYSSSLLYSKSKKYYAPVKAGNGSDDEEIDSNIEREDSQEQGKEGWSGGDLNLRREPHSSTSSLKKSGAKLEKPQYPSQNYLTENLNRIEVSISKEPKSNWRQAADKKNHGEAMQEIAKEKNVELTRDIGRGFFPKDQALHAEQPKEIDYQGARARQLLHHHSEVLNWFLKSRGLKPGEVQSMWAQRGEDLSLMVSANQKESQEYLQGMTAEQINEIYKEAATQEPRGESDARAHKSANKVLEYEQLEARRIENAKQQGARQEDPEDLRRARILAKMARDGNFSVVVNKANDGDGVHAERNLKKAYENETVTRKKIGIGTKNDAFDIAGTKIRCGSCVMGVGEDQKASVLRMDNMKGHDGGKEGDEVPYQTGQFYPRQVSVGVFREQVGNYVDDGERGRTRAVVRGKAERTRSKSPAPRKQPPADKGSQVKGDKKIKSGKSIRSEKEEELD